MQHVHLTTQFSVSSKLGKGAFNLIVQIICEDIEQHEAYHRPLADPTCEGLPACMKDINHHPLSVVC